MPPRTASFALAAQERTPLLERVAAERGSATPRQSGVRLIDTGEEALATLIALADAAQRTLDLQYYAVLNETSTRVLLQHVRAAADRGVRVRFLIDDFNTVGTDDALLRLTRHPHIAVRLYNPLPAGRFSLPTRVIASLGDIARINSRMHNKQLVADNALAVTGGRNLGDAYFLQSAEANFVDLDLLVAGPAVQRLSATFDRYWNSDMAYPARVLIAGAGVPPPEPAASAPQMDAPDVLPVETQTRVQTLLQQFAAQPLGLRWAPVRLLADTPDKTSSEGEPHPDDNMFDDLAALMGSAQREVLLVTPYFVPGERGMALISGLRQRGVRVRVLTASLAGTDAPAVHIGYSRYREALLRLGVELFELRPEPGGPKPSRFGGVHSRTNLHAKALLVDGRTVVVGSMNFDPRSALLNTEMGLAVSSAPLAAQLQSLIARICAEDAYQVGADAAGQLRWRYRDDNGETVELTSEPDVSWLKLLGLKLLSPIAPEAML